MPVPLLLLTLLLLPCTRASASDPVQEEVAGMIGLFYDLRLPESLAAAEALSRRHPAHPAGAFYTGIAHYQRLLVEVPPSSATLRAFRTEMDRCIVLASSASALSPAWREYYLGAGYGFRARVSSMRADWLDALRDARAAVGHVQRAVALDPSLEDGYLGLGMYHYFMARLPAPAKPFAYLLIGLWGDREKGLAELERAAARAPVASSEALAVLAFVYASRREGRLERASEILAMLMERHPRNPAFRLWLARLAARRGLYAESAALCDPKGGWVEVVTEPARAQSRAAAAYLHAEALLLAGDSAKAAAALEAAGDPPPGRLRDWTLLRRGNLFDLLGRRADALALYREVGGDARKAAVSFQHDPFPGKERPLMPLRWPLTGLPEQS